MPTLSQMLILPATLLVALACVLLGTLIGARRPGVALFAGWGIGVLVLNLAATLAGMALTPVLIGVLLVSLGGLARWRQLDWSMAGKVALLGIPYLLILATVIPAGYDEYNQWLPNQTYLIAYDHVPSLARPNLLSIHPGYPYALGYIGLAVGRLTGGLAESSGIVWNAVLTLAVASLAGEALAKRSGVAGWKVAAVALMFSTLASPVFIPLLYVSGYGDSITGLVCAAMAAFALCDMMDSRTRWIDGMLLALIGVAGVAVRPDSIANIAIVYGGLSLLGLWRIAGGRGPDLRPMLAWVPLVLLGWFLWQHYQTAEIPGGVARILPRAEWPLEQLPDVLGVFARVAMQKIGYFGLLLALIVGAVWPRRIAPETRAACILGASIGLAKIAAMAGIYMTVECCGPNVRSAPEYWRYTIQLAPAVVLVALTLLPIRPLLTRFRRLTPALPVVALLLPLLAISVLHIDWPKKGHVDYIRERQMADDIARLIPPAASLTLIELGEDPGNAPQSFPLRYLLRRFHPAEMAPPLAILAGTPQEIVEIDGHIPHFHPHDTTLAATRAQVLSAEYYWFADGGADASSLAGIDLPAGESLLVRHNGGVAEIVARWKRM